MFSQKTKMSSFVVVLIGLLSSASIVADETPAETCSSAASLFSEGDIEGALEEARWCVTQLEQLKQGATSAYFKDEINGYKGGELENQQAMGIEVTERRYDKGQKSIKVTLTGGASGSTNNAFAALASFGISASPGKKIRIQRRSALVNSESRTVTLTVTLKSGGMLVFDTDDVSKDELITFAKAFPVADLDDSRK